MNETLLDVRDLKMHFPVSGGLLSRVVGQVYAVDGVSFSVRKGETLGIVGESGCGKSTLGKAILQLYRPTSGTVLFNNENLNNLSDYQLKSRRRQVQMIFQDPYESLDPRMTIEEILSEPFIIHKMGDKIQRKQWAKELLAKVGLPPSGIDRYPHEFSGGQRQRIGIARAVALRPQLILCDEPVSALDVSVQSQILNLLVDLQNEMGLSYIFIAHDLAVVKHMSDRIAVMYLGKIVELADADLIYKQPLHPYTQALIASIPEPDPAHRHVLKALEGEVPSPINPPSGCHFHTRCPFATPECKTKIPVLRSIGQTSVACHHGEKFAHLS